MAIRQIGREGMIMAQSVQGSRAADQGKKIVDQVTAVANDTLSQGTVVAEEAGQATQQTLSEAVVSLREINLRILDMAQTNINLLFEFAREAASADDPGRLVKLWSQQMQKQFEILGRQGKELTTMAQDSAKATAKPLSHAFENALKD
jgi:hypothetical protein